jgi:hypothetical protein
VAGQTLSSTATGNEVFGSVLDNFTGFTHPTKQTNKQSQQTHNLQTYTSKFNWKPVLLW